MLDFLENANNQKNICKQKYHKIRNLLKSFYSLQKFSCKFIEKVDPLFKNFSEIVSHNKNLDEIYL